ncbi:dynein axonemal intermediate chain 3 [Myripristis murdjan]|uniref:dynein axonemal intermediate chain 3 n=1 Tax=Myripristis murdjan TaxID=586833 RepID=UPI0011763999|nr:WD repeat-containing protein 63 [Myripristis murdjan]
MSSKTPKSTVSSAGSKRKGKDKKSVTPVHSESVPGPGHPDDIFPLVLTSATQELFGCRADEDVTGESPYKLLRKDDIVQDMKRRAAVSDFSTVKQIVLDYPEEEILLVFDRDFTYGQGFYLVLTPEAKEKILNPPLRSETETSGECEVYKTPEPKLWISLGSEQDIEEESVKESREKLKYKLSRVRRKFGTLVCFSDWNTADAKDGDVECASYSDSRFSIKQMERDCGIQAIPKLQSSSAQTQWKNQKNMCTQYEPRGFSEEEKESLVQSGSLKNFINSVTPRVLQSLQQNEIMDVFLDNWTALGIGAEEFDTGERANNLMVYQAFTDMQYSKDKTISSINWHPTISGVIAVAMTENVSLEQRFNQSTKFLLNPPLILFWCFHDACTPQLLLECPDDVFAFEFCPTDPNIIIGGCMNGQVVLWDISTHVKYLQGSMPRVRKETSNSDAFDFEENRENETPLVRYCAVSAVDSGHKAQITDVQWLPQTFEVTKTGTPVENKNKTCVQAITCSPDCSVMFWDIRVSVNQPATKLKQNVDQKQPVKSYGVPDTFSHLDRSWKPLLKVSLPMIDVNGEYSPLKFSLQDYICDSHTGSNTDAAHLHEDRAEVTPDYSKLQVPSAKTLKSLDDVNTKFFVGTEDGEIVYTDWRLEKDNDSGRLHSAKPLHCFNVHDWWVNTVQRSPFFKDVILTVGGWNFAIWKEGVMDGTIFQSPPSTQVCTAGCWSPSRPAVFFIGKANGNIEVWDLLEKTHDPSQIHNITSTKITCIKPWIFSSKQHFLAVSDDKGMLHILEIPRMLYRPSSDEKLRVRIYLETEVDRLVYFTKRRDVWAEEKKDTEAMELKKKSEPMKSLDYFNEEEQKEYQEYQELETSILKSMGLLPATDNMKEF